MAADSKNGSSTPKRFLEPPAVTALRQEARESNPSSPVPMRRTLSEDIREQCEDLKEAAEQTLNVVVDLDMEGRINWVSPSWKEIIGTEAEDAEGQFIRDLIFDGKTVFEEASENLTRDDSRSQIVRFSIKVGSESIFWHEPSKPEKEDVFSPGDETEGALATQQNEEENVLSLEGQGIMVYEQASGGGGHVSSLCHSFAINSLLTSQYRLCGCYVHRRVRERLPLGFLPCLSSRLEWEQKCSRVI